MLFQCEMFMNYSKNCISIDVKKVCKDVDVKKYGLQNYLRL